MREKAKRGGERKQSKQPLKPANCWTFLFFFAMQLSMIFDILLCLAEDVTESAFVEGERSGSYGRYIPVTMKSSEHPKRMLMRSARAMLWQRLRGVELKGGQLTMFRGVFLIM